ncbi:hypothetical protein BLX24_14410 [Arsenicibacter rosenii]|uniref:DNA-binding response regulator n=2 Tax=Arsenicibacter rosenii TaxID=1750698 RepID=A0A1S2VJ52_9BACT|nr:hypothetical protein BLX24_14410 [Arsenicibacter rosenii]
MSQTQFDVVFLDCHLPDMNGLDLISQFSKISKIIVTTAHVNLAVVCFDIDEIIDYIVKPFEFPRFLRAVRRAISDLTPIQKDAEDKEVIYLKAGRTFARFIVSEILYVEAFGAYVKVYTTQGFTVINQRLAPLLKNELKSKRFIRVHKSFIINSDYLAKIDANKLFIGSTKIPIGITYRTAFTKYLQQAGIIDKDQKPKK